MRIAYWIASSTAVLSMAIASLLLGGCDSMTPMRQRLDVEILSTANKEPVAHAPITAARWEYNETTKPTPDVLASQLGTMARTGKNTSVTDQNGRAKIYVETMAMGTALHPPDTHPSAGLIGGTVIFRVEHGEALEYLTIRNIQSGSEQSGRLFRVVVNDITPNVRAGP